MFPLEICRKQAQMRVSQNIFPQPAPFPPSPPPPPPPPPAQPLSTEPNFFGVPKHLRLRLRNAFRDRAFYKTMVLPILLQSWSKNGEETWRM